MLEGIQQAYKNFVVLIRCLLVPEMIHRWGIYQVSDSPPVEAWKVAMHIYEKKK